MLRLLDHECPCGHDVLRFDTRWDEVLLSTGGVLLDAILESLYKNAATRVSSTQDRVGTV